MSNTPHIVNVHTPTTSFAIQHSFTQETFVSLCDKLSRKTNNGANGQRIGSGWLKYEWNESIWNLDDDSDYTIFNWRHKQVPDTGSNSPSHLPTSTSYQTEATIYLHDPKQALPSTDDYHNSSYYAYQRQASPPPTSIRSKSRTRSVMSASGKSKKTSVNLNGHGDTSNHGIPQHKKDFMKFHNENGVRTVMGGIGPVTDVRMLLKNGYRHVYISRAFAKKHHFIPADAAPGMYGYGGLVNIGQWPITVGRTKTTHSVFLAEETHFDVILGRSFMERRGIKLEPTDLTSVVCMDTGEKIDCELVVIRDGKGEIVTVT